MVICKPGTTIYWDIDDTIIMWNKPDSKLHKGLKEIEVECNGFKSNVYVHVRHVELIKQYAERGATNIVWSHGGTVWGEAVIRALKLQDYVFACLNKPTMYYDDLDASKFMKQRRFFNIEEEKDELY